MTRPYDDQELPRHTYPRLTLVQHELLRQISQGLANKDIAVRLGKSPNTVRNQIHTLFRITGARSRSEIARWYLRCSAEARIAAERPGVWSVFARQKDVKVTREVPFPDSEY